MKHSNLVCSRIVTYLLLSKLIIHLLLLVQLLLFGVQSVLDEADFVQLVLDAILATMETQQGQWTITAGDASQIEQCDKPLFWC